jgi:hypothetical protein
VEVDDEFLKDRLETGRLENGRSQRRPPTSASRWSDQAAAESVITDALRINASKVNGDIDRGLHEVELVAPAPADAGVIWTRNSGGGYDEVAVARVKVVLLEAGDGSWYVETAYLLGAPA